MSGQLDGRPASHRLDGSHDARVRFGRRVRAKVSPLPPRDVCRAIFDSALRPHIRLVPSPMPLRGRCWIVNRGTNTGGYVQIAWGGVLYVAHRIAFVAFVGALEPDELACHTCDVRACANPEHLFRGDFEANAMDMARKSRAGRTRITAETVRAVREATGTLIDIATRYGISRSYAGYIRQGRVWRHLS